MVAVTTVSAVPILPAVERAEATDKACRPIFVELSGKSTTFRFRSNQWEVEAALIGCEADLTGLTSGDRKAITEALKAFFDEEDLRVLGRLRERPLRKTVSERLNAAVKKDIISDILFLKANRWE